MNRQVVRRRIGIVDLAADHPGELDQLVVVTAGHLRQLDFLVAAAVRPAGFIEREHHPRRFERPDVRRAPIAANDKLSSIIKTLFFIHLPVKYH